MQLLLELHPHILREGLFPLTLVTCSLGLKVDSYVFQMQPEGHNKLLSSVQLRYLNPRVLIFEGINVKFKYTFTSEQMLKDHV